MFQKLIRLKIMSSLLLLFLYSLSTQAQVTMDELSIETQIRLERVPEFKFIQEEANKLGVKVYLFGGTASAFAHYVRWDLEREAGDEKYQAERFDYDFTNIYRGNQDLDIVVDGTAEQAEALQSILKEKYPHFVGDRDAWEVRLLRASIGDKRPLLGDVDFRNQHTDTNSTGMISLNPNPGDGIYRDIMDWDNPRSQFLADIANAQIKYLFNENHSSTQRFLDGNNPPVLSAIRYLAKLTQYEVVGTSEDLSLITRIIAEQDFTQLGSYSKKKVKEFSLKALLNTPDVEFSYDLLNRVGLIDKLFEMDEQGVEDIGSLSWWADKEPLKSFELGQGAGRTAAEIFGKDLIVSHETKSFIAYENITRSTKGRANVFISRDERGVFGESAAYGSGFYTATGLRGAVGSGLTIRFRLHPDAKEDTDFHFIKENGYVVIQNKNAITLIPENMNLGTYGLLKLITSEELKETDLGLLEKFKRKLQRSTNTDEADFKNALDFLNTQLVSLIENERVEILSIIVEYILSQQAWSSYPKIIEYLIDSRLVDQQLVDHVLSKSYWGTRLDWLKLLIRNGHIDMYESFLSLSKESDWGKHPEVAEMFIENIDALEDVLEFVLSSETWSHHPHLIEILINKGDLDGDIVEYVLSKDYWGGEHSKLVDIILERGLADYSIILYVLTQEYSKNHPKWLISLIRRGKHIGLLEKHVLTLPHWREHSEIKPYLRGRDLSFRDISVSAEVDGEVKFSKLYKIFEQFSEDQNQIGFSSYDMEYRLWTKSDNFENWNNLTREVKSIVKEWAEAQSVSKEDIIYRGKWLLQNQSGNRMGFSTSVYIFEFDDGVSVPRIFAFSENDVWQSGIDSVIDYSSVVNLTDEEYRSLMPGKSISGRNSEQDLNGLILDRGSIFDDFVGVFRSFFVTNAEPAIESEQEYSLNRGDGKVQFSYLYEIFEKFSEDQNQAIMLESESNQRIWDEALTLDKVEHLDIRAGEIVLNWVHDRGIAADDIIFRGEWPIQEYSMDGVKMSVSAYVFEYNNGVSEPTFFTFSKTDTWGAQLNLRVEYSQVETLTVEDYENLLPGGALMKSEIFKRELTCKSFLLL